MSKEQTQLEVTPVDIVEIAKTAEPIVLNDLSLTLVGGGQYVVTF